MTEEQLKRKIKDLESLIQKYEENGIAKLYYSLNRKSWEMADLMNSINLKDLDIDTPQSKTFDRLKVIWQDASDLASAVKGLGETAGITGDEKKDVSRKGSFLDKVVS
jgi:hypothetical protein